MLEAGYGIGDSIGLLAAVSVISLVGCALTLRLLACQTQAGLWPATRRLIPAGGLLAGTAWWVFLLALRLRFPHLEADIAWPVLLQSWALVGAGAFASLGIAAHARRSARNVALAGSIMSAAVSCMVFASMSGLAAPSALAYDLPRVIATMAVSSTLLAGSFWLAGRAMPARVVAPLLMAASLAVLAIMSLSSILPFSEWQLEAGTPGAIAFRPVTVVFLSELGVTLVLGTAGAGVDRRAAAQIARENARLRQFTESTFEALLIHREGEILDANSIFCDLIGQPLAAVQGKPATEFLPESEIVADAVRIVGKPKAVEIEIMAADGAVARHRLWRGQGPRHGTARHSRASSGRGAHPVPCPARSIDRLAEPLAIP
jgi:PAS domain-containing protein